MKNQMTATLGQAADQLIVALNSLKDGDRAAELMVACGRRAIPFLADFLLKRSAELAAAPFLFTLRKGGVSDVAPS